MKCLKNSLTCVTIQPGLRIYCADRTKTYRVELLFRPAPVNRRPAARIRIALERRKSMEMKNGKERIRLKDILILQAVIVIYTRSSVTAKLASGQEPFSAPFLLFYLAELMILGVYALLWQQMIRKFELSVAYTNRAMALLWSMLWAVLLFHDRITVKNGIGAALVIAGTVIVNGGKARLHGDGKEERADA